MLGDKSYLILLPIFALLFGFFTVSEGLETDISTKVKGLNRRQWKRIVDRVYGWDLPKLNSTEVLTSLKEAEEIYNKLRSEGLVLDYDRDKATGVKELIDASRIVGFKCDPRSFEHFHELEKSYKFFDVHILPYLKNQSIKHYELCKTKLEGDLREGVATLPMETKDGARMLLFEITSTRIKFFDDDLHLLNELSRAAYEKRRVYLDIPEEYLVNGILSYLEFESGPLNSDEILHAKKGMKIYERKFNETIVRMCKTIIKNIGEPIEIYSNIIYHKDLGNQLDEFTTEWLNLGRICMNIIDKSKLFTKLTYDVLLERNPFNQGKTSPRQAQHNNVVEGSDQIGQLKDRAANKQRKADVKPTRKEKILKYLRMKKKVKSSVKD